MTPTAGTGRGVAVDQTTPVAFLSYTHYDDEHDGGNITAFRKALEGEVRVQAGRHDIEIFQDRDGIAWGQAWKERIDDSLDAVTFLVPVLTPTFLNSPQCRRELRRFVDRERRLGRKDLILPVYWIEAPALKNPALRSSDELAEELAARQYTDWRELRFQDLGQPETRRALARLAIHIRDVLGSAESLRPAVETVERASVANADIPRAASEECGGEIRPRHSASRDAAEACLEPEAAPPAPSPLGSRTAGPHANPSPDAEAPGVKFWNSATTSVAYLFGALSAFFALGFVATFIGSFTSDVPPVIYLTYLFLLPPVLVPFWLYLGARKPLAVGAAGIRVVKPSFRRRVRRIPWDELATVEIRRLPKGIFGNSLCIVATLRPGSANPLGLEWTGYGYRICNIKRLRGSPGTVRDALIRYSGGRYKTEMLPQQVDAG